MPEESRIMKAKKSGMPLYLKILLALVAGAGCGTVLGPKAFLLGELGKVLIQLIKALAAPLLFLAIVEAFLKTEVKAKAGARLLAMSSLNAMAAVAIGLLVSAWLRPGEHLKTILVPSGGAEAQVPERIHFLNALTSYIPSNLVEPFAQNAIITIVLIALLFGAGLRKARALHPNERGFETVENGIAALLRATEVMLTWVIQLAPLAVFGVVARVIGEHGLAAVQGLLVYVGTVLFGLLVYILLVYQAWIKFVAKKPLLEFWKGARDSIVYAMGASSSLATLPVTLQCLDKMKVSKQSSRLAACVGTNLNHDGIILYEAMAVLMVAQAHGISLSLEQQLLAAAASVMAGIGIAGVPEAGFISLSLVLTTVGLPLDGLPLLLTVDWILGRARAMTNVTSDMTVAVVLDSIEAKRT